MGGGLRWRTNAPILPSHSCLPLSPSCLCRTCIDRGQGQVKEQWVKSKLWPQTKPHCQSPGELGQTSDKSPIFLFGSNLLSTGDLCDLGQKGVEGQHTKSSYPLSLHLHLCLPRTRKGEPGMKSQKEKRKGKGNRGGDDWFSLKPSESLSELSSSGLPSIWSTANELQTHIASVSRKKPLKWWLPGEVLKRVQRTNPKGEPLPLELRALTPMNTKFSTFPVMLPSLLALFLLERSKEEQERVWSSTQRWSI